jgi:hypothetical protein
MTSRLQTVTPSHQETSGRQRRGTIMHPSGWGIKNIPHHDLVAGNDDAEEKNVTQFFSNQQRHSINQV